MRWGEQMGQQWRAKDEKNKTHKLEWRAPPLETIFFLSFFLVQFFFSFSLSIGMYYEKMACNTM